MRLPPFTEKRCYRPPIKPPIIGTLMVHIIATNSQGRRCTDSNTQQWLRASA